MKKLQSRFLDRLPDRAQGIVKLAEEVVAGDGVSADKARREAHKLAGTAGSFGYERVSESAKRLEDLLKRDTKTRSVAIAEASANLNESIRDAAKPKRTRRDSVPRVGLAGNSKASWQCMELLSNELIEVFPISTSGPRTVPGHANLDVVIVDATDGSPKGISAPMEFICALRASHRGTALPVILLVSDLTLETRIAAAHAGADLILAVPLSRSGITEAIRMVTSKQLERPVVLAIDDDPDALELIQACLESSFNVVTLSDPSQLLAALQEHSPSALVLDFDMPEYHGLQLCASVRMSRENKQIPIIFVTNHDDQKSRRAAFAAGCDDYLIKSLVKQELAFRLSSHIQRTAGLRTAAEIDSLTGLLLRRGFIPALESRISEATRRGTPLSLCMLDIDLFKKVNDTHGHLVGDRVLADLGSLILQRFRREDLRCRWGGEEFAIAFPGETAETIQRVMTTLLGEFSERVFHGENEDFQVTFSAGIASLGSDGRSMDQLMATADDRLYMAKSAGRARITAGPWNVLVASGG